MNQHIHVGNLLGRFLISLLPFIHFIPPRQCRAFPLRLLRTSCKDSPGCPVSFMVMGIVEISTFYFPLPGKLSNGDTILATVHFPSLFPKFLHKFPFTHPTQGGLPSRQLLQGFLRQPSICASRASIHVRPWWSCGIIGHMPTSEPSETSRSGEISC